MPVSDSLDDFRWNDARAARWRLQLSSRASRSATLGDQPLQLVDRDESRAPRHLERLDQRQDAAVECRAAHAERLGGLGARVGESLNTRRFSDDLGRRRGGLGAVMASRLLASAFQATTRHAYTVHEY
ncbi:MAG: hypothetical protein WD249_13330 [Gaiellaceae bacterium]